MYIYLCIHLNKYKVKMIMCPVMGRRSGNFYEATY